MHYHIVNRKTGGVVNRVTHAEHENDTDPKELRDKKRKAQATKMLNAWTDNAKVSDLTLVEVPSYD